MGLETIDELKAMAATDPGGMTVDQIEQLARYQKLVADGKKDAKPTMKAIKSKVAKGGLDSLTSAELRTFRDFEKFAAAEPKTKAKSKKPANVLQLPENFDVGAELKKIIPEIFRGLVEMSQSETGIARLTALKMLKDWADEVDTGDQEEYEIVAAQPENVKVHSLDEEREAALRKKVAKAGE